MIRTLLSALEFQILIFSSRKFQQAIEMQTAKNDITFAISERSLERIVKSALPLSERREVDGKSSLRMRGSFSTKFQVSN